MNLKKLFPILFFLILISAFSIALVNAEPRFTPLNIYEYYNDSIETSMIFDGANYLYVTPYGNYSITQPLNIISFTDYQGNEIIEKSIFVLQYNSTGSWLPLLDFMDHQGDPVVSIANQTHFRLDYNIYDKRTIIATGKLALTVNPDPETRPKIEVEVSITDDWNKGSFRWIWDVVPSSDYRYWRNQTTGELKDINELGALTELNNAPKIGLHNGYSNSIGFLDVSDYGSTTWYAGQEPNWNTKGYVTIFPVNETTIDPITYTESAPEDITPPATTGWQEIDAGSAPSNSIAEIIGRNGATGTNNLVGARNTSSSINRYLLLNEAEDGGYSANRFLSSVDASGNIDLYRDSSDVRYYSVGYWENVTFTEQWVQYNTLSSEDDMWHETDGTELSLQPNRTHLISLININVGSQDYLGVRNTSSSLERRLEVMEAEGGGAQTASMYVQTDTDSKIDVYTSDYVDVYFINQGYFDENTTFQEDWDAVSANNGYKENDLSTLYGVPFYSITDFWFRNILEIASVSTGGRTGGSSNNRQILLREAEGGGSSSYGMSVKVNSTGFVELRSDGAYDQYYTGYFATPPSPPISPPTIYDPSLLFGAGFNWSDPYIHIRWNHSGTVSNYTIQHSTNGVAYSVLAVTPNKYYNHTSLINGSYHWYKVRADYYWNVTPEWINSSLSDPDLERVWFLRGAGGGSPCPPANATVLDGAWVEYNVSSVSVEAGTYDVGWLNSTQFVDGNVYRVNESVGVDPLDVRFNFTGIPEDALSLGIMPYCEYEGNPAHVVVLEVWNFEDSSWELLEVIPEHGFSWHNHSLSFGDYIEDVTGDVWIRYDHQTNGANGHYVTVDYLKLRAFVPIGDNVDAWSINWLTSLLWIGVLAIASGTRSGTLTLFSGFLGLILGLLMLSTNTMVAISLILLNLYLIYTGSE